MRSFKIIFLTFLFSTLYFLPSISNADITTGLVGYWNFDEGSGTVASDSSGNNNNANLVNGPLWIAGKIGNAVSFDGTNDKVDVKNISIWDLANTNHSFSLWFKASVDSSGTDFLIDRFTGGNPGAGYLISLNQKGSINLSERADGGKSLSITDYTKNYKDDMWHHTVVIVDVSSKTGTLYVDGVNKGTDIYTGNLINQNEALTFGNDSSGSTYIFSGLIDDVRIYNRLLSTTDILELYNFTQNNPLLLSNLSPSGNIYQIANSVNLSLITDKGSICRYSEISGINYESMTNTFSTPDGLSHIANITNLNSGNTYSYYVKCKDYSGNANSNDYVINFNFNKISISNPQAIPFSETMIKISWSLSLIDSDGEYKYKIFRNETEIATTSNLFYYDHGLSPQTSYSYEISAYDTSGNISNKTNPVSLFTLYPKNVVNYYRSVYDSVYESQKNLLDSMASSGFGSTYYTFQYPLSATISLFEATKDMKYMERSLKWAETMLSKATIVDNNNNHNWGGTWLSNYSGTSTAYQLEDLQGSTELARLARIILSDKYLNSIYGSRANALYYFVKKDIVEKHVWVRGGYSWFINQACVVQIGKYPFNDKVALLLRILSDVYLIGKEEKYKNFAMELSNCYKDRIKIYTNYPSAFIVDEGVGESDATAYDTSHANRLPLSIIDLYKAGIVFTTDYINAFANLLAGVIWDKSYDSPRFTNYIDGTNGYYLDRPAWNNGSIYSGWIHLGEFNQSAQEISHSALKAIMDGKRNPSLDYNATDCCGKLQLLGQLAKNIVFKNKEAASTPVGLSSSILGSSVNLSWNPSRDNLLVYGYYIYRDGTEMFFTTSTSYTDTNLSPNSTYSYQVSAYDSSGNESGKSEAIIVTTQSSTSLSAFNSGGGSANGAINPGISAPGSSSATTTATSTATSTITNIVSSESNIASSSSSLSAESSTSGIQSNVQHSMSNIQILFIKPLKFKSEGEEVKQLQQILNNHGFVIAKEGAGSKGNETNHFGSLTREAVKKFQCQHNIVCSGNEQTTGYGLLGPKTREKLNELSATTPSTSDVEGKGNGAQPVQHPMSNINTQEQIINLKQQLIQLMMQVVEMLNNKSAKR